MKVRIIPPAAANPPGKLADAELHFEAGDGPLEGLRLIGFSIWERRGGSRNVTFPARQYAVNGERRSFALLRPLADPGDSGTFAAQDRLRELVLEAYAEFVAASSEPHTVGTDVPTPENDPVGRFRKRGKA